MAAAASDVYVGIDGGGTKTSAVVVDSTGAQLSTTETGCSNWNSIGQQGARDNLVNAITTACAAAGRTIADVAKICLGMAGVDRPADITLVTSWMTELLRPGAEIAVHNDAVGALASGTLGTLHGVVVISGTGTIAYGYTSAGERARCAGWGPLLGDGGSGYAIGSDILRAVMRSADGRAEHTALQEAVMKKLNLTTVDELIPWVYKDTAWARVADLAPLAFELYETDAAAKRILHTAADELSQGVIHVSRKLRLAVDASSAPYTVVLAGGILKNEIMTRLVTERLHPALPNAMLVHPKVSPALGAALLSVNGTA
eukprot:TRINITY_DN12396_c0_g1_i1.p1 TRINITY_DN12396_c0_g1~~TRINITY_DN12396_c0_g1_i1.p1  ORF type:complete len:315 (-),score=69.04 TRINITY_DN12396_c0_g1_i1:96-1040(-)